MLQSMQERGGDTVFAQRLKSAREDAGLTQAALGELVGVTQRNISDLESERRGRRIEPPVVRALADALDVTAGYLLGDSDEPFNIPGWTDLTEVQRQEIRSLIRLRGQLNRDLAAAAGGGARQSSEVTDTRRKVRASSPVRTGRPKKPRSTR